MREPLVKSLLRNINAWMSVPCHARVPEPMPSEGPVALFQGHADDRKRPNHAAHVALSAFEAGRHAGERFLENSATALALKCILMNRSVDSPTWTVRLSLWVVRDLSRACLHWG